MSPRCPSLGTRGLVQNSGGGGSSGSVNSEEEEQGLRSETWNEGVDAVPGWKLKKVGDFVDLPLSGNGPIKRGLSFCWGRRRRRSGWTARPSLLADTWE